MPLAITDVHRDLAASARSVFRDRSTFAEAHEAMEDTTSRAPAYWKDAVALGWVGLPVDEQHGGQGAGLAECAVVLEQAGAHLAGGPLLSTMLGAALLQELGPEWLRATWLPLVCAGDVEIAVGLTTELASAAGRLSGTSSLVLGGVEAGLYLLPVGADLVLVTAGEVEVEAYADPYDRSRPVLRLRCTDATPLAVIAGGRRRAETLGWLFASAEAAGVISACVEMSVAYVSRREQFGRPVGGFQAVKHHCANLVVAAELAGASVWDAARGADHADEADLCAAVAATMCLPAAVSAAELNIQLHGGIGYTWEHDAHLLLRRATALAAYFGPPRNASNAVLALRRDGVARGSGVVLPASAEHHRAEARAFRATYRATPVEERQALAARAGYVVPHWPRPYGREADAVEQLVIDEELVELPRQTLGLGEWVLPTVLQHGTDEQRERLLWPGLEGRVRWCQLFSEPGAGSDAAAVSTRARRVEGGWRVNGQKVWTSDAHVSDLGLATVRTDPQAAKHAGITAMVIDLHAPGVEVRPLREITGESLFNEVFLDDVFVPDRDVVGAVNGGWRVARATLANERLSIGGISSSIGADELLRLTDRYATTDCGVLSEVGELLSEAQALRALNLRQVDRAITGAEGGPEGNIAKLVSGEHAQRVASLGLRITGPAGVLGAEPSLVRDTLFTRCLTIAGGTSEVVRTQIAERILGLPRDSPDTTRRASTTSTTDQESR